MQQENPNKYLLKYRNVDDLFNDVQDDLKKWTVEGMIDTSNLLKTVIHCNANLGLKIQPDKETIIDIDNYYGKLPSDFHKFNEGVICTGFKVTQPADYPKRELKEIETLDPTLRCQVDPCQVKSICGKSYVTTETRRYETIEVTSVCPVALRNTARKMCADECPNYALTCENEMSIRGDQIDTNFKKGSLWISYVGMMETEDGKLQILSHPLIDPYYEAAVKYKIFSDLFDNGEQVQHLEAKWQAKYKECKGEAENIVSTPEYEQLARMHARHRARIRNTYYRMIY